MSRDAAARLFVAVDPPPPVREELAGWGRGVAAAARAAGSPRGALRLLDARSLHVTLCFLGSRPVGEIDALCDALAVCVAGAFELSVGAPLWLPPRRASTLAVEVHDRSGGLARLQRQAGEALCAVSAWRPERRRFRPHITVARVRRGAGGGRVARSQRAGREPALPATPPLSFTPRALVLYRSWLAPEGASYEALASSGLEPAAR
jgi:RNA 2',3'-cyclic 3'-phosphodiesterase